MSPSSCIAGPHRIRRMSFNCCFSWKLWLILIHINTSFMWIIDVVPLSLWDGTQFMQFPIAAIPTNWAVSMPNSKRNVKSAPNGADVGDGLVPKEKSNQFLMPHRWAAICELNVLIDINVIAMIWESLPCHWASVRWIHMPTVDSDIKGPALRNFDIFFAIGLTKKYTNSGVTGDLWHHYTHVTSV